MTRNEYATYLRSDHWRAVKQRYRNSKMPKRCLICKNAKYELHHRSYRRLGNERLHDLVPLCRACHQATHDHLKRHASGRTTLFTAHKKRRIVWRKGARPSPSI